MVFPTRLSLGTPTTATIGHRLHPSELHRLLDQLDPAHTGSVSRAHVAAAVMDFAALHQGRHRDLWLSSVRRVFDGLDANGDGVLSTEEIVEAIKEKLPATEVERAIAQALEEASLHGGSVPGLDFEAFLKLLRTGAPDDLTQYDDRMGGVGSSSESLAEEAAAAFDAEAAAAAAETMQRTDVAGACCRGGWP